MPAFHSDPSANTSTSSLRQSPLAAGSGTGDERAGVNREHEVRAVNGWLMLIVDILILLAGVGLLVLSIVLAATEGMTAGPITMLVGPGIVLC